jgi:membrane-associated phospholipid phosphatase
MKKGLGALAALLLVVAAVPVVLLATQRPSGGSVTAIAADMPPGSGTIVVDWNKALLKVFSTPGAQPATVHPTRSLAILHAAMYDAVVSITRGGQPYLVSVNASPKARPDAAAAQAGHDVLAALYPSLSTTFDQQLSSELAVIPSVVSKDQGIQVGRLVAESILAARTADGSSVAPPALPDGTDPGQYRRTPPTNAAAVFTQWPDVTPFVLQRADQFRPGPPPALTSDAYTQAYDEVKNLGQNTSPTRTADETTAAKFWPGPIWVQWNEIAEASALNHHTDLVRTASLFALLNLAFADTVIAFYDAKYHYLLWRPITAIREGDNDGNAATMGDPTWTPLLATGADPSYPGAHSAVSGAGAAVLTAFFGSHDQIKVTSDALPGVVRSFDSYGAAASEAGLSRIFGGVHTRYDHEAGLQLGRDVASFVLSESRSPGFGLIGT